MQLHSLIVSEPAGIVSGFAAGLATYYAAGFLGMDQHFSMILGCIAHFATNTVVAGHVNLFLLDFLALAIRLPAAGGSALWMSHFISSGHLLKL